MRSYGRQSLAAALVCLVATAGCDDSTGPFGVDEPRIVFASNRDGDFEIFKMDSDGSNVEQLTNDLLSDDQPVWTPDGEDIVFVSERSGNRDIWKMDDDGDDPLNISLNAGIDDHPSVSPDGGRIAFASDRAGGNFDIYVMSIDGSGVVRLTTEDAVDTSPAWSPDGLKIAFQSTRGDGLAEDIFVMDADGTDVVRLTTDAGADWSPSWNADGTKIFFVSWRPGGTEIFSMNPDGSAKTNETNAGGFDTQPFASTSRPLDLVWTSTRDFGSQEIYVRLGTGAPVRLTNNISVDDHAAIR